MTPPLTEATKVVLLLTAPLIVGRESPHGPKTLSPTEYNKLAARLAELGNKPDDLMLASKKSIFTRFSDIIETARLEALLNRGLLMSQAVDQWQARGIWVASRGDSSYPKRLKQKLKSHAPPIVYGCGSLQLLESGGLGIVGSRKVDPTITAFVEHNAMLAAQSGYSVVSGGARGVDQIAMEAALKVDGTVVGALAENLSRAVVSPLFREPIKRHAVVLLSAVDPNAGFSVGNAMARNKLIYALSDAGLIANADYEKGGTWAGAIEQINRFKCCPVYVRTAERTPKGNQALIERGAHPWTEPQGVEAFRKLLNEEKTNQAKPEVQELCFQSEESPSKKYNKAHTEVFDSNESPAQAIQQAAESAILKVLKDKPLNESELADLLKINKVQIRTWIETMLKNKKIKKTKSPIKYTLSEQEEMQL